jgi:hypothetical protein
MRARCAGQFLHDWRLVTSWFSACACLSGPWVLRFVLSTPNLRSVLHLGFGGVKILPKISQLGDRRGYIKVISILIVLS